MLLVARGGRWRRCSGRCWGYVPDQHSLLPSIALTNLNPCPIALELYRTAVLALKSLPPFRVPPYLIARRTYNVRGILIVLGEMVADMKLLKQICQHLLDGLT